MRENSRPRFGFYIIKRNRFSTFGYQPREQPNFWNQLRSTE